MKRILLIEDDIDDQHFFSEALTQIHPSITCQIAKDGAIALELLAEPPPFELIFLDLNLPKIDGFECLRRLKEDTTYKEVPVIILSTSNREDDVERCRALGAAAFITKPKTFDALLEKLATILTV